jgi:hypothetical protein
MEEWADEKSLTQKKNPAIAAAGFDSGNGIGLRF